MTDNKPFSFIVYVVTVPLASVSLTTALPSRSVMLVALPFVASTFTPFVSLSTSTFTPPVILTSISLSANTEPLLNVAVAVVASSVTLSAVAKIAVLTVNVPVLSIVTVAAKLEVKDCPFVITPAFTVTASPRLVSLVNV